MVKSTLAAEKIGAFSLLRPNAKYIRVSKGIVGSLILHALVLGLGFSVAFQIGQPKVTPERSTFRWEVTLSEAPFQEAVTSDSPESSLSAPAASSKNRVHKRNESRKDISAEFFDKSKSSKTRFNKGLIASAATKPNPSDALLEPNASNSRKFSQKSTHTMPFTHGKTANLPPPIDKIVDRAERVQQAGTLEEPKIIQRSPRYYRHIRKLNTRPDYGWLIEDLRTKLEKLKFYPQMARHNKWEGKVIVQMKILADGHMVDAAVEKSSGFDLLDQAALTIVRKASPIELGHPLVASNVILSVPLTFQLE